MKMIVPHLWFDTQAKEAALFYVALFEGSRFINATTLHETPSGDAEIVQFQLSGIPFMAISAGPYFPLNPSVSLMVACTSADEVDTKWKSLSQGGTPLMELGEYPFSKRYGWIQDRYGLSWQLMLVEGDTVSQKITPNLLFSGAVCGKAEEAVRFYTDLFPESQIGTISHYGPRESQSGNASVNYASFRLCSTAFSAMDNGYDVDFTFNEGFSLIVRCETQEEIDYYWERLSAVPEAEQCGWLKDKYGLSWQIIPTVMDEMMSSASAEEAKRLTEAFLKMKKFDIKQLECAFKGTSPC